jgi:mannan endo-1,4-beta-mannosidase
MLDEWKARGILQAIAACLAAALLIWLVTAETATFVTRQGRQLIAGGQPYRFVGVNIYNANSTKDNCWYTMGTGPALDSALSAMPGQSVFRAWFFQREATTNGLRDWKAFDHTLSVAKAHGERVIATLSDQWGACEDGIYKNERWYQSGYRTAVAAGMTQTYHEWVGTIVSRYKDNPTIMAWQLMNEAEDQTAGQGSACSATAEATLRSWAADMASFVKSIDRNHLLSIGTIGSGQCGGREYSSLHAIAGVDLCEYHDYGQPQSPMPGDQWHGLQVQLDRCNALNKPLFVGETGIYGVGPTIRAADFRAKFAAQFSAGIVGELIWAWRGGGQGGSTTTGYEVGPGDPTLMLFPGAPP